MFENEGEEGDRIERPLNPQLLASSTFGRATFAFHP